MNVNSNTDLNNNDNNTNTNTNTETTKKNYCCRWLYTHLYGCRRLSIPVGKCVWLYKTVYGPIWLYMGSIWLYIMFNGILRTYCFSASLVGNTLTHSHALFAFLCQRCTDCCGYQKLRCLANPYIRTTIYSHIQQ